MACDLAGITHLNVTCVCREVPRTVTISMRMIEKSSTH